MIAQGDDCHVVNTASGAGLHTRPLGMYAATKHAGRRPVRGDVSRTEAHRHPGRRLSPCPAVVNTRIGESERNRPQAMTNEGPAGNPAQMAAMEQAFRGGARCRVGAGRRRGCGVRSDPRRAVLHPDARGDEGQSAGEDGGHLGGGNPTPQPLA